MAAERIDQPDDADLSLPPHNLRAEDEVIGAIIKSAGHVLDKIRHLLDPSSFYGQTSMEVYAAACRLYDRRIPVDYATIDRELRSMGSKVTLLEVSRYDLRTPTAAHGEHYANIVNEMAVRRRLIGAASSVAEWAWDVRQELPTVLSRTEAVVQAASMTSRVGDRSKSLEEESVRYAKEIREGVKRDLVGLGTPWWVINKFTLGLQAANVYLQPARTQVGKSILGEQLAVFFAEHHGPVFFASLEMGQRKLLQRGVAMSTGISRQRVLKQDFMPEERETAAQASLALGRLPIRTWTGPGSIEQITAAATRYQADVGQLSLLVVDYVQLLTSESERGTREQVVAACSRGIKALAEKLNVAVWAPVQVSREAVKRVSDLIPELHDMRESGALEQDADYVIALARDDPQTPIADMRYPGEAVVVLLKDRDTGNAGQRGWLKWNKQGEYYQDADPRLHTHDRDRGGVLPGSEVA